MIESYIDNLAKRKKYTLRTNNIFLMVNIFEMYDAKVYFFYSMQQRKKFQTLKKQVSVLEFR